VKIAVVNRHFIPELAIIVRQCRVDRGTDEFAELVVGESAKLLDPFLAECYAVFGSYVEHNHVANAFQLQFFLLLVDEPVNY